MWLINACGKEGSNRSRLLDNEQRFLGMDESPPVTQLLLQWTNGNEAALQQLVPLVYRELHRLASSCLRREPPGNTLQPTALVHEAYLRLVDQNPNFRNRSHFFGVAAHLIRQILVDR